MTNVCSAKPNVRPAASSFEKPSSARSDTRMPRTTKSMYTRRSAAAPTSPISCAIAEKMKSVRRYGMSCDPSGDVNVPWPSPVPTQPPFPIEYRLFTSWYEAQSWRSASSPVIEQYTGSSVQGCSQIVTRLLDVVDRVVEHCGAADEEREPRGDEQRPAGRDVEHREEDPEVQERAPEVVRDDDDEHRRAPDREQRPDVLELPARERLALLAQVAREEDDEADLRELARLELDRPEVDPEPRAVDRSPSPGTDGSSSSATAADAEQVAVRLEDAVVVPEPDQRPAEGRDADQHPHRLSAAVVGVEAVDVMTPNAVSTAVSGSSAPSAYGTVTPHDDVRDDVEAEEERAVGERVRGDLGVARERDGRERHARDETGDHEPEELPRPGVHR